MSVPSLILTSACVLLATFVLTSALRRYALRTNLLDTPNGRSSHRTPTARGGGLAFVIVILTVAGGFALIGWMPIQWAAGILGAGGSLAAIGWIDDKGHVAASLRFAVHAAAAGVLIYAIGPLSLKFLGLNSLALAWIVSLGGIVWMINLVNFMDGIDGLAASEAAFVSAGLAALLALAGHADGTAAFALLLAVAVAGFLILNWPPASIFMGDVGSGFLGGMLAALVLMASRFGWPYAAATLILLTAFLCDATVTLIRRMLRGQKVWQAHRSHAYQRLARRWHSHRRVTVTVLFLNLLFLLPLALAVVTRMLDPFAGIFAAWVPVTGLVILAGAGLPDEDENERAQKAPS